LRGVSKDEAIENADQQWLLRGGSNPSLEIGGRLGGEGLVAERESLGVSLLDTARRSS
jgi:hypothetical protein